jgi:hypothetical protein
MDNKTIATILWVAAVAVLILYFLRRRSRRSSTFKK